MFTPGVATVSPMWVNGNLWRIVNDQDMSQHGLRRGIMVVGFDLGDPVFRLENLDANLSNNYSADALTAFSCATTRYSYLWSGNGYYKVKVAK